MKLGAVAAIIATSALAGCSASNLGDGLGVKSAVSMLRPSALKSTPGSTRGKRYKASERERQCLARAMFFESNRSSRDGLVAVGSVVMNRRDSGKWGSDICSVVGAKRQFAPGVLSRKMNSKALPDVMDAADAVLAGERHPKVHQNVMFFHTAGLRFPYKNMKYTVIAGGNHFYEKVSRRKRGEALPGIDQSIAPDVMVASAEPETPAATAFASPRRKQRAAVQTEASPAEDLEVTTADERQPRLVRPVSPDEAISAPDPRRFAGIETFAPPPSEPSITEAAAEPMPEASPEQATQVGQTLLLQQAQ